MFVEALKRQNPALISAALSLWQQGKIAPDSWVIDVDQVLENGKRLIETARLYGIELYLMTKQLLHRRSLAAAAMTRVTPLTGGVAR